MPEQSKLTATPAQIQSLRRAVKSFGKFEDEIIGVWAGRGDLQKSLWFIYCCSLAAEINTRKVERRALRMRKSTLARLADYAGHQITVEDARRMLDGLGCPDEDAASIIGADIERLANLPARGPRKPRWMRG
jgi:hypothetical protein